MGSLSALVLMIATIVVVLPPQSKPDFTGTWVVVSPADAAGQEETLTQDAQTLSLGHPSEGGHHRRTYRLDGTETKSVLQSHGEDIVTTSRAAWEGATLVIHETTRYPDNRTLEARRTLSLDADGRLLRTFTGRMNGQALPEMKTLSRKR